jgi:hypothetical protein
VQSPIGVYAKTFTIEAVDCLVAIGRNAEIPPQARVMAWREILDRGHGKPAQAVSVTGHDGGQLTTRIIHEDWRGVVVASLDRLSPQIESETALSPQKQIAASVDTLEAKATPIEGVSPPDVA